MGNKFIMKKVLKELDNNFVIEIILFNRSLLSEISKERTNLTF